MKRLLAITVALLMMLTAFAGCTSKTDEPTTKKAPVKEKTEEPKVTEAPEEPKEPLVFNYAFDDEPPGMDPSIFVGSSISNIYNAQYEGLVTVDRDGNIVPAAAEKWTISDDKTVYTFTLRDGLTWSDGQPVTAKDYEYAWLRVITPETASYYSWFPTMFLKNGSEFNKGEVEASEVGVKALDDKTLEVTLIEPASFFMQAVLTTCFMPVRQDMVEKSPDKWWQDPATAISNGPFILKEYAIGSHYTLVKNEEYWNADAVSIDEISFKFIEDQNTALSAFQAGDLDGISSVPSAEFVSLLTTDDRLYTFDRLAFSFIRLNTKVAGLDNQKVRRAINIGFDRQGYLDGIGQITSVPALGTVPSGQILAGKDFRATSGDNGLTPAAQVEAAQALLEEAGFAGGEGLPTYSIHCMDSQLKDAEILQQMLLTNLGINSEIKPVDSKLFWPMTINGEYDIQFGGWGGDYEHAMTFLELFTSTANDNCTGWINEEFDTLLKEARSESNEATALDKMIKAEHILVEESPIVPTKFPGGAIMMQEEWSNWSISSKGTLYIAYATKGE